MIRRVCVRNSAIFVSGRFNWNACYNVGMELSKSEIPEILAYYRVGELGLVFDGYEQIAPDSKLYYFHDPKNNDLYALLLTDYVGWGMGNSEPDSWIMDDYYPGHECEWNVEHWLTCREKPDETVGHADYEGWFYWPECGNKCVFAKLKEDVSALNGRNLEKDIPEIEEEELSRRKARREELTEIDSERDC